MWGLYESIRWKYKDAIDLKLWDLLDIRPKELRLSASSLNSEEATKVEMILVVTAYKSLRRVRIKGLFAWPSEKVV